MPRLLALGLALLLTAAACGSSDEPVPLDPSVRAVALPGAGAPVDFDDIVYSPELRRVLVPARRSGLYLVEPRSGRVRRLPDVGAADSADAGRGLLFVLDREEQTVDVIDPDGGRALSSTPTRASGDYVRFVGSRNELWVTEPSASPPGIEIFELAGRGPPRPRASGFVEISDGPEGIVLGPRTGKAFVHAGEDVVAVDLRTRRPAGRWATGCGGTHGFPRIDERRGLLLASCDEDGEAALLDLDDGRRLGRHAVGGGESLPAFSPATGRFYVRSDPGTQLVALEASRRGLRAGRSVPVPEAGHCLTADDLGHLWTCDPEAGRVLRVEDR